MRALHLPAIAHEAGIKFDLFDVARIFERTPYIADLKPGGKYVAKDMFEAGGIPLLMKTLLDHGYLHGDCMTVTGRTLAENMEHVRLERSIRTWCVRPTSRSPQTGGVVGLKGNLAPEGRDREGCGHVRAEILGSGAVLRLRGGVLRGGDATASTRKARFSSSATRGPRAAPACAKCCRRRRRSTARAWAARWPSSPMGVSRARRAVSASAMSGRRRRSAARSGCLQDGDIITIDAVNGTLDVKLSDEELAARAKKWKPRTTDYQSGAIWKYAQTVGLGARRRRHPSGRSE